MKQEENENTKTCKFDLEERTFKFAKRCRDFVNNSQKTTANIEYGKQLVRSSGSQSANYIEANEAFLNQYLFQDKSISNTVIINKPPRVFIPNAFSPKGYNSKFYPVAVFVKSDDYIFRIFNRWGQILYETNIPGPLNGWDGTYEGKFVPAGVYVFYVRFKTATGDYFEKRGTVTVIK